jgi:hypothetical protein
VPVELNVPKWGKVQALTVAEAAKRLHVTANDITYWIECDLFESYDFDVTDKKSGKLKRRTTYIDLVDLAEVEKLEKQMFLDAPWERILWWHYERDQARKKQGQPDKRSVERTLVQPVRQNVRTEPPRSQPRRQPLPPELQELEDDELLEELETVQSPRRQGRQPVLRQQRQQVYQDYDEPTVRDTTSRHYPKKELPKQKRGWW